MSTSDAEFEFWTQDNDYHDLARRFEQGIERYHPDAVTSRGMCVCLDFTSWCDWASTSVTYYRYNGERV